MIAVIDGPDRFLSAGANPSQPLSFFKLIINRKVALTQSAQSGFLSQTQYAVGALKEGKGSIHLIEHEVRWLRSKVAIFHAWIDDYC